MSFLRTYWPAAGIAVAGLLASMLPTVVIVAAAAVALVSGAMGWVWHWLITSTIGGANDFGLRAGLLGGAAALGLADFIALLGPASVLVLPVAYAIAAMIFWALRHPRYS